MNVLENIIKTVLLCARQNIPMRGHRDDSTHELDPSLNTGNFKAMLSYRADGGDDQLQTHSEE